ncbi:MAG: 50S ribosomal protein L32e [Promethearchaeota archaeon]
MQKEKERLLRVRKVMKKKKPKFRRVESWRYKRVKPSWRKARGIDSKTRKKLKSGVKSPTVGYRAPKKIRGLHPSGYEEVNIMNIDEVKNLDNRKHVIRISAKLGNRKRMVLIEQLQKMNFKILNVGTSHKALKEFEEMLETPIEGMEEEDQLIDVEDLEETLLEKSEEE